MTTTPGTSTIIAKLSSTFTSHMRTALIPLHNHLTLHTTLKIIDIFENIGSQPLTFAVMVSHHAINTVNYVAFVTSSFLSVLLHFYYSSLTFLTGANFEVFSLSLHHCSKFYFIIFLNKILT